MKPKTVIVRDEQKRILFSGKVTSLPLKEEVILAKSKELFCDDDPCIIHKSYIMAKMFREIDACLSGSEPEIGKTNTVSLAGITKEVRGYLNLPSAASTIDLV